MCLVTVTEQYDPPLANEEYGHKVFAVRNGHWKFPFCFVMHKNKPTQCLSCGTWMKAMFDAIVEPIHAGRKIVAEDGHLYKPGFHIYTNVWDAYEFWTRIRPAVVVKVKYRGVTTRGMQFVSSSVRRASCIVAQEILVLENSIFVEDPQ